MYLVDTNILSAGRPERALESTALAIWMEAHTAQLYLSVVTITEIYDGIAKVRRVGATRKSEALQRWFDTILHLYADRILAFDIETARIAGILSDRARAAGHAPGFADIAIAATAARHQLTVLTRNRRHFDPLGVTIIDPFSEKLPQ